MPKPRSGAFVAQALKPGRKAWIRSRSRPDISTASLTFVYSTITKHSRCTMKSEQPRMVFVSPFTGTVVEPTLQPSLGRVWLVNETSMKSLGCNLLFGVEVHLFSPKTWVMLKTHSRPVGPHSVSAASNGAGREDCHR